MMRWRWSPLLFGLVLSLGAQSLSPAQRGRVDAVFSDFNVHTPGCVEGISAHGRMLYARGYGMASLESGTPLGPASVLEIGSVSKQFTAASIFLLDQAGKLKLDDPVRRYIPEFPAYAHPVTIRELLHHTSGVRDVIALMEMSGIPAGDAATQADALAMIERQRALNFVPNSRYMYSNSGYVLLAEIVRRVSGEPLNQFAAEHIFQPLGMSHTQFVADQTLVIPHRVRTYAPRPGGGWRLDVSPWDQIGDGGVNTTVGDLALWAANFWHPRVGGARLIRQLETQGVLNDGRTIAYAGGLEVGTYGGLRRVAHDGAWQGFRAQFTLFPGPELALITLCNAANADPGARSRKLAAIVLGNALAPTPASSPASPAAAPPSVAWTRARLRALAGRYHSEELQVSWTVALSGPALVLHTFGANPNRLDTDHVYAMRAEGAGFRAGPYRVRFDRRGMLVSAGRALDIQFVREGDHG